MKLGLFLIIIGYIIAFWFIGVSLAVVLLKWADTGVFYINWSAGWKSLAIGVFGGFLVYIGEERRRKSKRVVGE